MIQLERITSEDDPRRCQSIFQGGQCTNRNIEISEGRYTKNCAMHGGNKELENIKNNSLRNYRLTKWQARIQDYSDSPVVKSLREEIGILRLLLEETLSKCTSDVDLVLQSGHISDLVLKIEKLVTSCHILETKTGALLDKTMIIQIASEWIVAISSRLGDRPEVLEPIAEDLKNIISRVSNKDTEKCEHSVKQ